MESDAQSTTSSQRRKRQDEENQKKLDQLKKKFAPKQHDFMPGFTEVMVGEKLKACEDEDEMQKLLEEKQKDIRRNLQENLRRMIDIDRPRRSSMGTEKPSLAQYIKGVEDSLRNQYYLRI